MKQGYYLFNIDKSKYGHLPINSEDITMYYSFFILLSTKKFESLQKISIWATDAMKSHKYAKL